MGKFLRKYRNNFTIFEKNDFSLDNDFILEVKDLLLPSYVNPDSLIKRVINQYNHIIYSKNENGTLCSFFTVNFDFIDNEIICNLGLLAVRNEYKGSDLVFPLGYRCIELLKQKEIEVGKRILCWCTTATIQVYKIVQIFFDDCQPKCDGSIDSLGLQSLEKIVRGYKLNHDSSTPFVLKHHAVSTHYSFSEKQRIIRSVNNQNNSFFNSFNISEENGDRLIIIAFSPSDEKFNLISKRFKTSP